MKTTFHFTPLYIAALSSLFLTVAFLSPARAAEHIINFEAGLSGWSAIKGTSYFNWARHAGGTHSGHTGPNEAEEGNYYLYLEASRNTPSRIAYFQSPDFPETIKRISFHYHMYGAHMGTLELQGFDGSRWLQLWRVAGQQHGSHHAPWTRKEIDLSSKAIRKVRFKGVTGSGPGKLYRGDMAIDYLTITTNKEISAGHWSKSGSDIYFANGNVGIGIKDPKADLAVLGNLSKALTGHIGIPKGSSHITGVGTRFTQELAVGDSLLIGDRVFLVREILSDILLVLNAAHPTGAFNATAYTDSDLVSVRTGAEVTALAIDKSGNVGIGIGTGKPMVKLAVAGGVKIGSEKVCDAAREGTIRYNNTANEPEFCDGSKWTRVEGPAGPQGKQGNTGPRGLKGVKGDKGDTGARGLQGLKGDTGPQGIKGNKGDTGPRGLKGDKGDSFWSRSGSNIHYSGGNIGIGTSGPTTKLEVSGGIKLGNDANACTAAKAGVMKYVSGFLYFCNGVAWKVLPPLNPAANLAISPSNRLDMNVTQANNPGSYVTFTVTNHGPIVSGTMTTRLGNTTNFEVGTDSCNGKKLVSGATCTIQVRPKATKDGGITGSLNILANNNPRAFLEGVGSGIALYAFTAHTFTNCGKTGRTGPVLSQCRNSYSTTWDEDDHYFTVNGGIQRWTVPTTATYFIEAWGAGESYSGGAKIKGRFNLVAGNYLQIASGQQGEISGGGHGGTFVALGSSYSAATPLIIAGGGAGTTSQCNQNLQRATYSQTANPGNLGHGGTNGKGGNSTEFKTYGGGAGGGFYTDGKVGNSSYSSPGFAFRNGANGGNSATSSASKNGGFGGGGAGLPNNEPAGGGGYAGGGGGGASNYGSINGSCRFGGGGGSYNSGTDQQRIGFNNGHGKVVITKF